MSETREEWLATRASLLGRLGDKSHNTIWQDSWREFFDIYWKLIYGVARKRDLSDSEAQDVVQEVMAHVAKQMPAFKFDPAIGSFKGWLLTKTRWCIIAQQRRRGPRVSGSPDASPGDGSAVVDIPDPAWPSLEREWEVQWRQNLMEAGLVRLKQRVNALHLQIFDFYARKEIPAKEVAAKFAVPIEQVHLIKHRITSELAKEVKRLEREVT